MASSSPRLIVRHGPNPNQEYPLVLTSNIVGREPINDVVFADPEVSRRHARIVSQNNSYYIEDLGSTNGTFVNGRRISSITRLSDGDIIDLGESIRLTFVRDDDEPEAAATDTETESTQYVVPERPAASRLQPTPETFTPTAVVSDSLPVGGALESRRNFYLTLGCGGLLILLLLCIVLLFVFEQLGWISVLGV